MVGLVFLCECPRPFRRAATALLPKAELTPKRLVREMTALLADAARCRSKAVHALDLATPDAAERLVDLASP